MDDAVSTEPRMHRMRPRLAALSHPAFLAALLTLLLNDHLFKPLWHNALTGKLSDFAGLFALAWFVSAITGRSSRLAHVLIAGAFAWWKSPGSEPVITLWNTWMPMAMGRTVDATDLIALVVLPFSFVLFRRASRKSHRMPVTRSWHPVIALISVFAFTATSRAPEQLPAPVSYLSPVVPEALVATLQAQGGSAVAYDDRLEITFEDARCGFVDAVFQVGTAGDMTVLSLRSFEAGCDIRSRGLGPLFKGLQPRLVMLRARLPDRHAFPAARQPCAKPAGKP